MDITLLDANLEWEHYLLFLAGLVYVIIICVVHDKNMRIVSDNKEQARIARRLNNVLDGTPFQRRHKRLRNRAVVWMAVVMPVHALSYVMVYPDKLRPEYLLVVPMAYIFFVALIVLNFKLKGEKILHDTMPNRENPFF